MLRLAPTRISLTSADLDWHVRRHEKRLAKAKKAEPTRTQTEGPKSQHKSSKYRPSIDSDPMPTRNHRGNPVPIYSDEPVPQDSEESQPFWGGILAEVGAVNRGDRITAFRSHPPETFLENNGAFRLSVQRQEENHSSQDGPLEDLQISPRSPEFHPQSPASSSGSWTSASTQIQFRRTPISLPAYYTDEDSAELQPSDSLDQELDLESVVSNATAIHSTTFMQAHRTHFQHSRVNQMDVDGSSDTGPYLHHYRSTSSLQDPEPGLRGMPFGAQARKAELAASRNTSSSIDLGSPQSDLGTPDHALRDGYSPSHSSHQTRTRSGGLPRSRLYISEVMASSSPEKRQRSAAGSDHPVSSNGIGSVHTRVRKRYRRRDSSSFVGSEASDNHTHPAYSAYATENPFGGPPRSPPPGPIPYDSVLDTSSPGNTQHAYHDSQLLSSPSAYPNRASIHSSDYSSYDDLPSYDYSLLPRQPFHPLPVPTIVTPRTPSNNNPRPFIPASASENDSHIPYPYAPTTPASRSSSINLHPTHISIYNDSLPSYSQPQTPIGLPRNGLPRMYHQNPYYTAPARQGGPGPGRGRVVGNPDVFTTPTRAEGRQGLGVIGDGRPSERHNEQENVSVDIERERREQRNRERGSWTGGSVRGWRISEWEP
ncbi:MAG: hypothetical protein L6R38_004734 [Xanthoria sp. 2 TBL-2021]|nr:MAG: hypothetical protein L6R38_004734 [Xanthoria sp. 2 TBL-2021]